jgi:hypothetical protein
MAGGSVGQLGTIRDQIAAEVDPRKRQALRSANWEHLQRAEVV